MGLIIKNLSFSYNKVSILKNLSLNLESGKCGVLLGSNGVGKTTLLKCLASVNKFDDGEIILDNKNFKDMKQKEKSQLIAYVSQKQDDSTLTVFDTILLGRFPSFTYGPSKNDYMEVSRVIDELNLGSLALKQANQLSGGERQKVAIATAIVNNPHLLILDEPTSNLDLAAQLNVVALLKELKNKGITILISMHDISLASSLGDDFFFMKDGSIFASGGNSIISSNNIYKSYGVDVDVVSKDKNILIVPK